jgi:hypothetical protein
MKGFPFPGILFALHRTGRGDEMEGYDKEVDAVTVDELKAVFGRRNGKWELFMKIPGMLTMRSGDVDHPLSVGAPAL